MIKRITLVAAVIGMIGCPLFSQDLAMEAILQQDRENIRAMEKAHLSALRSADAARYQDLGEKALKIIEESLPRAIENYQQLLKGEQGILKSDAGKVHAQDPEVVEMLMRFVSEDILPGRQETDPEKLDVQRIDFGENERTQRAKLTRQAIKELQSGSGTDFDPKSGPAQTIEKNTSWASRAWESISSRNTLLEGYLATPTKGIKVSKLPTMQQEIEATIHRRMVVMGKALNEVERQAAAQKVKRMASLTKGIEADKLRDHLKKIEALAQKQRELDRANAEAEILEVDVAAKRKMQKTQEDYENAIATLKAREASLEKELAAKSLALDEVKAESLDLAKKLAVAQKMREMPADAKILIKLLSAPGYWAPGKIEVGGRGGVYLTMHHGRYDVTDPVPHSLTKLAASGALSDDPRGYLTLYFIMVSKGDTERPRLDGAIEPRQMNWGINLRLPSNQFSAVFTQNEDTRALLKRLKAIQAVVRTYGDQLVAQGLLAE